MSRLGVEVEIVAFALLIICGESVQVCMSHFDPASLAECLQKLLENEKLQK
jgi:hypothetical protein